MKHGFRARRTTSWQQHLPARRRHEDGIQYAWRVMGATNGAKPPMVVKHSELEEFSDRSAFKRYCPCCKQGILLVYRNQEHPEFLSCIDRCTICLQVFIYNILNLSNSTGYPLELIWEHVHGMPKHRLTLTSEQVRQIRVRESAA